MQHPTLYRYMSGRYETLRHEAALYERHNNELAHFFIPTSSSFGYTPALTDGTSKPTYGGNLYDMTTVKACDQLVNYILGALFNPNQEWVAAQVPQVIMEATRNDQPAQKKLVKYIKNANTACLEYLADHASGFYPSLERALYELAVFGEGYILMDIHPRTNSLRYRHVPLMNIVVEKDENNDVDTVFRRLTMRVDEVLKIWPEPVEGTYPEKWFEPHYDRNSRVTIIHGVVPNDKYMKLEDSKKELGPNKRWRSAHFIHTDQAIHNLHDQQESGQQLVLDHAGFDEFPYLCVSWQHFGTELRARGPGFKALPDARLLNEQQKLYMNACEKKLNPPSVAAHNAVMGGVPRLGARNNHNIIDTMTLEAIGGNVNNALQFLQVPIEAQETLLNIQQRQQSIREIFFNDVIEVAEKKAEMREVEVLAQQEERMRAMMLPLMRLYGQVAEPVMVRTYQFLKSTGAISEAPPELTTMSKKFGKLYKIRFNSAISRAFAQLELANFVRVLQQFILPLASVFPQIVDVFDPMQYVKFVFEVAQYNPDVIISEEEYQRKQQERQQEVSAQQQAETAKTTAQAVESTAKASQILR